MLNLQKYKINLKNQEIMIESTDVPCRSWLNVQNKIHIKSQIVVRDRILKDQQYSISFLSR